MPINEQTERNLIKVVYLIIAPIFISFLIYALLRERPPKLVTQIIDAIDAAEFISRAVTINKTPEWVIYNLPDGLWAFAFANFVFMTCRNEPDRLYKKLYFHMTWILIMSLEIAQAFKAYGTFDWLDLIALFLGIMLSAGFESHSR
jgi:hypothetical protein